MLRFFAVRPVQGFALVSMTMAAGALAVANGCSGGGDSSTGSEDGGGASSTSSSTSTSSGAGSSSGGTTSGSSGGSSSGGASDGGADADAGPPPCKTADDCKDRMPCATGVCGSDGKCTYTIAAGADGDGDGFASKALGACGDDCDDTDPTVNPDAGYHETTRDGGGYDWNCNGFEEPHWNTLWMGCKVSQGKCVGSGWATKIRTCGERGTYVNCFVSNGECASFDYADSGQECR